MVEIYRKNRSDDAIPGGKFFVGREPGGKNEIFGFKFWGGQSMKKTNIRALTESSIMIALSIVFGFVKLIDMPYGGSVTLASMLPIIIIAYRHGAGWGTLAALANSLVQLITGLGYFSYFTTWQSIVALALFDYIFAFAVFGLGGVFRKVMPQGAALSLGALLTSVVRYICHVISGATIWAGLSIPSGAALIYSFGYNATYMIPETIILVLAALYLGQLVDFEREIPTRKRSDVIDRAGAIAISLAGLVALSAVAADLALIFPKLQNATDGSFDITGLKSVSWGIVLAVTVCAALAVALILIIPKIRKNANKG